MIEDTGLESLCHNANTLNQFRKIISKLMHETFEEEERTKRKVVLENFNGELSAKKIIDLL